MKGKIALLLVIFILVSACSGSAANPGGNEAVTATPAAAATEVVQPLDDSKCSLTNDKGWPLVNEEHTPSGTLICRYNEPTTAPEDTPVPVTSSDKCPAYYNGYKYEIANGDHKDVVTSDGTMKMTCLGGGIVDYKFTPNSTSSGSACGQARDLGPWAPDANDTDKTFEITSTKGDSTGVVVGLWWPNGKTPWEKKEVTTLVEPGLSITVINGAGRGWDYPKECAQSEIDAQMKAHMTQRAQDTNYYGYVDIDELIKLGLVTVRFDRRAP